MPPRSQRTLPALAIAITLALASACTESGPAAPRPALLTPQTSRTLVSALAQVSSVNLGFLIGLDPAPGTEPGSLDFSADTIPCPASGTVISSGQLVFDSLGLASVDFIDRYHGCAIADADGHVWTFDATVPMHTYMALKNPEEPAEPWLFGFIIGTVRYTSETGAGECSFATQLRGFGDSLQVVGTICGFNVQALRTAAPQ